jgi:hypothetical protein
MQRFRQRSYCYRERVVRNNVVYPLYVEWFAIAHVLALKQIGSRAVHLNETLHF